MGGLLYEFNADGIKIKTELVMLPDHHGAISLRDFCPDGFWILWPYINHNKLAWTVWPYLAPS